MFDKIKLALSNITLKTIAKVISLILDTSELSSTIVNATQIRIICPS